MDQFGADKLVKKMEEYQGLYGAPFKPAQTLVDMAKDPSKKFHQNWTVLPKELIFPLEDSQS